MTNRIAFLGGAVLTVVLVFLRIVVIVGTGRPLPIPAIPLLAIAALAGGFCGVLFISLRGWRTAGGRKQILAYWLMGCALFLPVGLAAIPYSEIFDASDPPSAVEFAGILLAGVVGFGGLVGIGIKLYTDQFLG